MEMPVRIAVNVYLRNGMKKKMVQTSSALKHKSTTFVLIWNHNSLCMRKAHKFPFALTKNEIT